MSELDLETLASVCGGVDWRAVRQAAVAGAIGGGGFGAAIGGAAGVGVFSLPGAAVGTVLGASAGAITGAIGMASFDHWVSPLVAARVEERYRR